MPVNKIEIRRGTYYDSVVLMQLQASLLKQAGVANAGIMMGLPVNKELLQQNLLLTEEAEAAAPDDLIISIEATDEAAAQAALSKVDDLLSRRSQAVEQDYIPKSLEGAAKIAPDASWVMISVPGQYAAAVAREALASRKHVFLYSDNVPLQAEVELKHEARERGLLLMGPDCGTAIVNGVGFGFANQVRRGPIGLIGASGTGLQQVTSRIHQLGSGITHALGTGGRDLSLQVGGVTCRQSLDLFRRDPETKVIVLISKPPHPEVASALLQTARGAGKPVVVHFIGYATPAKIEEADNLYFTSSLSETADVAVKLASGHWQPLPPTVGPTSFSASQLYLRGLFSGGTLAQESLLILQNYLPRIYSNVPLKKDLKLSDPRISRGHTIVDLGEDEFTVGRPHPMLDNTLRLERLRQEAEDPCVAVILLDVVLGHGAHPDPAGEIASAISEALELAKHAERKLEIVAVVVGTDEDPQDFASQVERLQAAGARVETSVSTACAYVGRQLGGLAAPSALAAVDLTALQQPVAAINLGLESFASSIASQDAPVVHVDWRPPAGGNEKLIAILERMKTRTE